MDTGDEERLYWKKVGWKAKEFGLLPNATDADVLNHEQQKRAIAQNLPPTANWFEIFCAELRAGISPDLPDYCVCNEPDWADDPERAIGPARQAAKIFLVEK